MAAEMRSTTPATANTSRGVSARYASAPRMGGGPNHQHPDGEPYASNRSLTPSRYGMTGYANDDSYAVADQRTPSSTGLIRLSLKKPMGIVFEPMYDPNQKTLQRGVRICDLPRTGAAALSRKLQVGDELLQINDKTVSRLNFDQIMDFIIEADPESVNLLFRRPRKETLQARQGVQQKLNAAANKDAPSTVKWVDEDQVGTGAAATNARGKKEKPPASSSSRKKDAKKPVKRSKKGSVSEDEDETIQSSTAGDDSYVKNERRSRKKSKSRISRDPYESESFLDLLIDTICANSNNVCRDTFRRADDEYFSEDDESFVTDAEDESTYLTYDESLDARGKNRKKAARDDETEEDRQEREKEDDRRKHKKKDKEKTDSKGDKKKYDDDGTLETVDSAERAKPDDGVRASQPPLGLAPQPVAEAVKPVVPQPEVEPDVNAPIKELEYDDRIDHGADVSVMESLGGPSLLIEKQRAAAMQAANVAPKAVPPEILEKFGQNYPPAFGFSKQQTIEQDPLKFYTYVVKGLLEEHEPEKVRLLDKLLAKYKGREDHLVQKLAVRYGHEGDGQSPADPDDHNRDQAFSDAVQKSKASLNAAAAVHTAKERMYISDPVPEHPFEDEQWPEKETKEQDVGDDADNEDDEMESGSDFSRESVDGTSPAVIAQVSELLNYVYGKTSVPGQIDRVSTIMRAYEGREAVLLELLETKALIKANKEKENADNLPSFLRNTQQMTQAQKNAEQMEGSEMPPVTPMATQPVTDDISSMSGVSSPAQERDQAAGVANHSYYEDVEVQHHGPNVEVPGESIPVKDGPKLNTPSSRSTTKQPPSPEKKNKKKGLFGGLFAKKKHKESATPASRIARTTRKVKG